MFNFVFKCRINFNFNFNFNNVEKKAFTSEATVLCDNVNFIQVYCWLRIENRQMPSYPSSMMHPNWWWIVICCGGWMDGRMDGWTDGLDE